MRKLLTATRAAYLMVFFLGLAARFATMVAVRQPGYMDAFYYYHVASNLLHGRGFTEDFIWNYLSIPAAVTHPSNLYWMPLVSVLIYLSFLVFGEGFQTAQVSLAVVSAGLPVVAFWLGRDVFRSLRYAWAMALLTIFSGVVFVYWVVPDNFTPYALAGSLSLICVYKGLQRGPRYFAAAGALAGVGYLARPDGLLLVVAGLLMSPVVIWFRPVAALDPIQRGAAGDCPPPPSTPVPSTTLPSTPLRERAGEKLSSTAVPSTTLPSTSLRGRRGTSPRVLRRRTGRASGQAPNEAGTERWEFEVERPSEGHVRAGVKRALVAGGLLAVSFLVVVSPWLVRDRLTFGTPWPSAGAKTLFLTEYNDIFAYGKTLGLEQYLDWGWANILRSKGEAALRNLLVVGELHLFYMLPFAVAGFFLLRRRVAYWPFFAYGLLLFLAMTLGFTFPGPRGSFLHSASALLPFLFGAAICGLDAGVAAAGRRLKHWRVATAQRNFTIVFVVFAVLASVGFGVRAYSTWDEHLVAYRAVGDWLAPHLGPEDLVMTVDPPGFFYATGRKSIVVVNDELPVAITVCQHYGAKYILIGKAHPLSWHAFYLGKEDVVGLTLAGEVAGVRLYQVEASG